MYRASIYDAKNDFSSFVDKAERGDVIELTRNDSEVVAVLISYKKYKELKPSKNWFDTFREENSDALLTDGLPYMKSAEKPNLDMYQNMWDKA